MKEHDAKKPVFQSKHYVWLAYWFAKNATEAQTIKLMSDLSKDNPKFNVVRFRKAILEGKAK